MTKIYTHHPAIVEPLVETRSLLSTDELEFLRELGPLLDELRREPSDCLTQTILDYAALREW